MCPLHHNIWPTLTRRHVWTRMRRRCGLAGDETTRRPFLRRHTSCENFVNGCWSKVSLRAIALIDARLLLTPFPLAGSQQDYCICIIMLCIQYPSPFTDWTHLVSSSSRPISKDISSRWSNVTTWWRHRPPFVNVRSSSTQDGGCCWRNGPGARR